MDILKIIAIGIITTISAVILRQVKPELVIFVVITGSVLILFMVIETVGTVLGDYKALLDKTGINNGVFISVLKIIGVGYLVEFAGDICTDAGVPSVSSKILLAGKIMILVMCLPIIKNLIEVILKFIP